MPQMFMKNKELSKQLRDKVLEKFKVGLGYKTISCLTDPWTVLV